MKRSPISLRHRALCGWLKGNEPELFNNTLKLQKFLFFYECFSIIEGDPEVDIKNLKGYKMGPVFSDIYGALKYGKDDFIEYLPKAYATYNKKINKERVLLSAFIVKIMKKDELSEFTHSLNIWKSQENEIKNRKKGEKAVDLNLSDLNQRDIAVLQMLKTMYPISFIKNSFLIEESNKIFLFNQKDIKMLTEKHREILKQLDKEPDLHNPVYITIEEGVLCVD